MPYFPPKTVADALSAPTQNDMYLRGGSTGIHGWDLPPFLQALVNTTEFTNMRVFTQAANAFRDGTQTGYVTFYPTDNAAASGNALFSSIAFAVAMPFAGNVGSNDTCFCGGRVVASDLKSVTFNTTKGSVAVLGGTGLTSAPEGTLCFCLMIGVPV